MRDSRCRKSVDILHRSAYLLERLSLVDVQPQDIPTMGLPVQPAKNAWLGHGGSLEVGPAIDKGTPLPALRERSDRKAEVATPFAFLG